LRLTSLSCPSSFDAFATSAHVQIIQNVPITN
jgi:hypothetical protein